MEERLTIGPVSRMLGLSCQTLRNWDRRGIFKPARDYSGRRVYSEDDLKKLEERIFQKKE